MIPPLRRVPGARHLAASDLARYSAHMKSSITPSVRIDQDLLKELERCLAPGETVATFVTLAIRAEVDRRRCESAFAQRGRQAIARSEVAGDWSPADDVIGRAESKFAAARAWHRARSSCSAGLQQASGHEVARPYFDPAVMQDVRNGERWIDRVCKASGR